MKTPSTFLALALLSAGAYVASTPAQAATPVANTPAVKQVSTATSSPMHPAKIVHRKGKKKPR